MSTDSRGEWAVVVELPLTLLRPQPRLPLSINYPQDSAQESPAHSLARIALNNACLKEQGGPELREIWIRLQDGDHPKPKGTGKLAT